MIKFTIILIIVYFVSAKFTIIYVNGLDTIDKFRLANKKFTKGQSIWFLLLGLMRVASIIFGAISVIMLVVKYL